jgi:plasmid maintenance system antidote protein VapI
MKTIGVEEHNDAVFERLVRQEELILNVTNVLTEALNDAGVTKSELAKRIGRSPGFVSHVFGGGRNLTLRTISDISAALELQPTLNVSPTRQLDLNRRPVWQQDFHVRLPVSRKKIPLSNDSEYVTDMTAQVA